MTIQSDEYSLIAFLIVFNLLAGVGGSVLIAKNFLSVHAQKGSLLSYSIILLIIYFIECLAFPLGMATQVLTIGLGIVWGILLSWWFQYSLPTKKILRKALILSLYGSLPTLSFCIVIPILMIRDLRPLLNLQVSHQFGIPDFLPWPFNTILGFLFGLGIGTLILKTIATTGAALFLQINKVDYKSDRQMNQVSSIQ